MSNDRAWPAREETNPLTTGTCAIFGCVSQGEGRPTLGASRGVDRKHRGSDGSKTLGEHIAEITAVPTYRLHRLLNCTRDPVKYLILLVELTRMERATS
jgi:hypothetical protein